MNTLKFYPKKFQEAYEKNIKSSGSKIPAEKYHNNKFTAAIIITVISLILFYIFNIKLVYSILVFFFMNIFFYFRVSLMASTRIKKMEKIFPDVISLMASNLRSGITVDRAFLLAAREEFAPLDEEILKTGKEIATGKDTLYAFQKMSERIGSEKITKVIMLITSGLKAGGNISDLLEQTAANMKEKEVIEKKASSSILMYVIFIFFAVGIGAPVLFGLSSVLVEVVISITSMIPATDSSQMDLPFTFSNVAISLNFVIYFSVIFILVTNLISSLVIGLVNKGEEKAGLRLFIPLVIISMTIFFLIRIVLSKVLLETINIF
jgi:archaellum biogenesis protein FlaJ (TadC family)